MNILLLAHHYAVASGRYMTDALRRDGHTVMTAGPEHGAEIWGLTVNPDYIWTPSKHKDGWKPELILIMDSALTINRLDSVYHSVPHVVYGVDNHVRTYEQFNGQVDHFFLGHGHGARMGEPNVTWLPCAYDPVWFTPGLKWDARPTDVAMIGVMYGQRAELLHELMQVPHIRGAYGMGAIYREYADIYQHSKISVVRSAAGDVAQRVWETAAMGCLVLMDDCPDCTALGLADHENCLIYHDVREAVDLTRWALEHPRKASDIAAAGQAWAAPSTWDARSRVIIEWIETFTKSQKRQKAEPK